MKAVVHVRYGPPDQVLQLQDVDAPAIGADEVLVSVRAASIHPDVWHVVTGFPFVLRLMGNGVRTPKRRVPGSDLSGVVESIGGNVTRFKVGDAVFGECSLSWHNGGAFAEYAAVRADVLAHKPEHVTFAQAASVATTGLIALTSLRPDRIQPGQEVLINGAGGNVGSLAVQIAKARGARVTAVDNSHKRELLRTLGADRVIDYTQEDVLQQSARYDLILDVASTLSLAACERVLTPTGLYVLVGHDHYGDASGRMFGSIPRMIAIMVRALCGHRHLPKPDFTIPGKGAVMDTLAQLLESGTITPVIARTFSLSEVPAAIQCLREGRAPGRIVVVP